MERLRGLSRVSKSSSVVFKWRATRIPAMIPSTRLRPSSMGDSIYLRLLFVYTLSPSTGGYNAGLCETHFWSLRSLPQESSFP